MRSWQRWACSRADVTCRGAPDPEYLALATTEFAKRQFGQEDGDQAIRSSTLNPTVASALIAGGISVASFAFNAWTTSRTLHAARAASLRDRQASVYQQIL